MKFQKCILPGDRDTLLAFFELYALTASYSHLKNVYNSIKFLHKSMNQAFIEEEFQINTVLQSIKRKLTNVPFQVLSITPQILKDLYNFIDIRIPADLALWSSVLLAFYCLFRKSNVASKRFQNFNSTKELSQISFAISLISTLFLSIQISQRRTSL